MADSDSDFFERPQRARPRRRPGNGKSAGARGSVRQKARTESSAHSLQHRAACDGARAACDGVGAACDGPCDPTGDQTGDRTKGLALQASSGSGGADAPTHTSATDHEELPSQQDSPISYSRWLSSRVARTAGAVAAASTTGGGSPLAESSGPSLSSPFAAPPPRSRLSRGREKTGGCENRRPSQTRHESAKRRVASEHGCAQKRAKSSRAAASDISQHGDRCQMCSQPWHRSGPHQLCSLACGHLFGFCCIEESDPRPPLPAPPPPSLPPYPNPRSPHTPTGGAQEESSEQAREVRVPHLSTYSAQIAYTSDLCDGRGEG